MNPEKFNDTLDLKKRNLTRGEVEYINNLRLNRPIKNYIEHEWSKSEEVQVKEKSSKEKRKVVKRYMIGLIFLVIYYLMAFDPASELFSGFFGGFKYTEILLSPIEWVLTLLFSIFLTFALIMGIMGVSNLNKTSLLEDKILLEFFEKKHFLIRLYQILHSIILMFSLFVLQNYYFLTIFILIMSFSIILLIKFKKKLNGQAYFLIGQIRGSKITNKKVN